MGEETAVHHADVADAGQVGRSAQDAGRFASEVLVLDVGGVVAIRAVEHAAAGEGFEEAGVIAADGLVALDLVEVFAPAEAAHGGDLRHQEGFRAECFRGALLGVDAQAGDGRSHHDDAGHPDDDAEQGQKAPQFVTADGIRRQPESILKLLPGTGHPGTRYDHVLPG